MYFLIENKLLFVESGSEDLIAELEGVFNILAIVAENSIETLMWILDDLGVNWELFDFIDEKLR